jgi:hypothetical protein
MAKMKLFSTKGMFPKMNWQKMAGVSKKDLGLPPMKPKRRRMSIKKMLRDV